MNVVEALAACIAGPWRVAAHRQHFDRSEDQVLAWDGKNWFSWIEQEEAWIEVDFLEEGGWIKPHDIVKDNGSPIPWAVVPVSDIENTKDRKLVEVLS